jgi:hypothetical protein
VNPDIALASRMSEKCHQQSPAPFFSDLAGDRPGHSNFSSHVLQAKGTPWTRPQ